MVGNTQLLLKNSSKKLKFWSYSASFAFKKCKKYTAYYRREGIRASKFVRFTRLKNFCRFLEVLRCLRVNFKPL